MRRVGVLLIAAAMLFVCLAAPASADVPETIVLSRPVDGWADSYLSFLSGNYDIFAALWPDGMSGVGFMDLDLDGTPEMVVLDQGASATMGAQLFDLVDGRVYCVSSTMDSASGAFDAAYLRSVSVCTNFFESFRLGRTEAGWCFWVDSSNSTLETAWDEIVRFDSVNGVLTPVSICSRYLKADPQTGLVVQDSYTVGGAAADAAGYTAAADVYREGQDVGYEAKGVFLWSNFDAYSTSYDGFMAMARDAAASYVSIADTVTLVSWAQ